MDAAQLFTALIEPAGRADPYPLYTRLHELGVATPAGPGFFVVTGYDAITAVLRDATFRVYDAEDLDRIFPDWHEHPAVGGHALLSLNAPDHTRIRGLMSRAFSQRRISGLTPAVETITDRLLDAMADAGAGGAAVEFMHDFAFELPVRVICELIGVPEEDREMFRSPSRALTATLEPLVTAEQFAAADAAAVELAGYFNGLIAERRLQPRDDLLTVLVQAADGGDGRLSDDELMDNLVLLLVAGFETTTNLLGNGLQVALQQPKIGDRVRRGAVPAAAFVDEVLRYDSPIQATSRRKGQPCQIAGHDVGANDEVVLLLGAGNRDARKFTDPGTFNPERSEAAPLSFSGGAHFCLGAALARLEGTVAFPRLLARFPALAAAGNPERRSGLVLRGFETLPVHLS